MKPLFFFLLVSISLAVAMAGNRQSWHGEVESEKTKTQWPEVVGLHAEEAARIIRADVPWARVEIVPPNAKITAEFDPNRVRIFVDYHELVLHIPIIG